MLFYLTGSSCSGKSTIAFDPAIAADVEVDDTDELGVPSTADLVWRQETLETWIRRALGGAPRSSTRRARTIQQAVADTRSWIASCRAARDADALPLGGSWWETPDVAQISMRDRAE